MECVSCGKDYPFIEMVFAAVRPGDTKRYRCWLCYDRLARYVDEEANYVDPDHYCGGIPLDPRPILASVSGSNSIAFDEDEEDCYHCYGEGCVECSY